MKQTKIFGPVAACLFVAHVFPHLFGPVPACLFVALSLTSLVLCQPVFLLLCHSCLWSCDSLSFCCFVTHVFGPVPACLFVALSLTSLVLCQPVFLLLCHSRLSPSLCRPTFCCFVTRVFPSVSCLVPACLFVALSRMSFSPEIIVMVSWT